MHKGEDNHAWLGDDVSYWGGHSRVRRARGAAKTHGCSVCGEKSMDKTYHWANLTGNYADVNDYVPMCVLCHNRHDWKNKMTGICAYPNCTIPIAQSCNKHGFCAFHLARQTSRLKHGIISNMYEYADEPKEVVKPLKQPVRCVYPNCNKMTIKGNMLCTKHYKKQWSRVKSGLSESLHDFSITMTDYEEYKDVKICMYPNCNETNLGKSGMCQKHYKAQWFQKKKGNIDSIHDFSKVVSG